MSFCLSAVIHGDVVVVDGRREVGEGGLVGVLLAHVDDVGDAVGKQVGDVAREVVSQPQSPPVASRCVTKLMLAMMSSCSFVARKRGAISVDCGVS